SCGFGCAALEAHLAKRGLDRLDRAGHVLRRDAADAADAEGGRRGELARIDGEALGEQAVIELFESEAGVGGRPEGDDDRRLQLVRQKRLEAEPAHAVDQDATVLPVAGA